MPVQAVKELEQALDELEEEKRRDGIDSRRKVADERKARWPVEGSSLVACIWSHCKSAALLDGGIKLPQLT